MADYIDLKQIAERLKCGHDDAWAVPVSRPVAEALARIYGFTVTPDAHARVSGVGAGGALAECVAVRIV